MMLSRVRRSEKVFDAIQDCTSCLSDPIETFRWVVFGQSDVIELQPFVGRRNMGCYLGAQI